MAILVDCELHKLRLSIWCFSVRNLRPWAWLTGLSLLEINCGALECFYFIWCAYSWGLTCLEWWRMVLVLPTHKWFSWEPQVCMGLHQSQSTYLVRDFDYYISHVTLHISILTWFLVIFEARDTALLPSRDNRVSVWPHGFKLSLGLGYQLLSGCSCCIGYFIFMLGDECFCFSLIFGLSSWKILMDCIYLCHSGPNLLTFPIWCLLLGSSLRVTMPSSRSYRS